MTLEEQALQLLVKQISVIYNEKINDLSFDSTYTGIVEKIVNSRTYIVNYNGASRTFKTKNILPISVGSTVHIVHPQNNISAKFLLEDIVTSASSANGGSGSVTSVNGYTGVVNLDADYYRKSEIDDMLENVSNEDVTDIKNDLNTHTKNSNIHITTSERTNWNDANSKKHEHSNKSVLDTITSALITAWNNAVDHISDAVKHITAQERTDWDLAKAHADSKHAPSNASVVKDSATNGNINIDGSEVNVYEHPDSTVTAGTYKSVTVDKRGHITFGSNPTTLEGFGITDAEAKGSVLNHNYSTTAHTDIRDMIDDLREDLDEIGEIGGFTDLYNKVSGTSAIISDGIEINLKSLSVYGKSEQFTTTGAQLANLPDIDPTEVSGITWSCKDGVVTVNGTSNVTSSSTTAGIQYKMPIVAGDYYISGNANGVSFYANIDNGDGTFSYPTNKKFTLSGSEVSCTLYCQIASGVNVSNVKVYPMLNAGSAVLPWEPYTGGKPSPNPEYPQEISSVGDGGSVEVSVLTGNVYDSAFRPSNGTIRGTGCDVVENNDFFIVTAKKADFYVYNVANKGDNYTDTMHGYLIPVPDGAKQIYVNVTNQMMNLHFVSYFDSDKVGIGTTRHTTNIFTSSVISGAKYFTLRFGKSDATVGTVYETKVMVNYASEQLQHVPYSKQTFTLQTPNGLRGIPVTSGGNYTDSNGQQWIADEIRLKSAGTGVWVHNVTKVKPTKTLVFASKLDDGRFSLFGKPFGEVFATGATPSLSTIAPWSSFASGADETFALAGEGFYYKDSIKTLEEVNALFAELGTDFEVLGVLKTPYETELSAEEVEAFLALHTNTPVTTVLNDEDTYMSVEYYKNSTNGNGNTGIIEHIISRNNPHYTTKSHIGLGNVENKSSEIIRSEITKANVTDALGYTPPTSDTTYGVATSSALGLIKSGTDITVDANGNVSVKDDSHNHVISNVDGLQDALDAKADDEELPIYLTQAEYDALPDSKLTDGKLYMITDNDNIPGSGGSVDLTEVYDRLDELEQSFQAGCDAIADECTASGSTPSAKTPSGIVAAIKKIFTDRYNAGVSATKKGTATAADVLSGKTFTNSSTVGVTGTMINRNIVDSTLGGINSDYPNTAIHKGTNPQIGTTVTSAEKLFALRPPAGYYNGSYVGILQSELASKIGLTAAKILYGNTILGIAGSAPSFTMKEYDVVYGSATQTITFANAYTRCLVCTAATRDGTGITVNSRNHSVSGTATRVFSHGIGGENNPPSSSTNVLHLELYYCKNIKAGDKLVTTYNGALCTRYAIVSF